MTFAVRTSVKSTAIIAQLRSKIRAIDATIRVGQFRTLEEHVDESLGHERLMATLSSLFAGLAAVLACVGLYGVMAYAVARRTNEIGIRMALGAGRTRVLGMILGESLTLVAVGFAMGLPAAIAAARLISGQLYGLKVGDPLTVVGSLLLLTVVAALAACIPARRATKVDPMVALRYE